MSTLIPITHDNPWIMRFCTACIAYVGFICVQILFLTYVDEIEDFYCRNYVIAGGEEVNVTMNVHQGGKLSQGADDIEGAATPATRTFAQKVYFYFNRYDKNKNVEDQPMPVWLRLLVDLFRPIEVLTKFRQNRRVAEAADVQTLKYNYDDAKFSVIWVIRVFSVVALACILGLYFASIDMSE